MPTLTLIAGYLIVVTVGALALLVVWNVLIGKIDLRYLISEEDGSASLSRFQFLIFTFVIAMCVMLLTLKSGEFPKLDPQIMALLGISGGSYVVSKGIQKSWEKRQSHEEDSKT